jgi:hypothetical protein
VRVMIIGSDVAGTSDSTARAEESDTGFREACVSIGTSLGRAGFDLHLCSPMVGSADLLAFQGWRGAVTASSARAHFFFPDHPVVREEFDEVACDRTLPHLQSPPQGETPAAWRNAWLLSQLSALDATDAVVAIAGNAEGSSNLLLTLARQRRQPIVPFPFLGGTAALALDRSRYELGDKIGDDSLAELSSPGSVARCAEFIQGVVRPQAGLHQSEGRLAEPEFFISYAHERPGEADLVEAVLRRRNFVVRRDESAFDAGYEIRELVREGIARADVFIALWCREYACSPSCFDEMEQALERKQRGSLDMWIFCLDETRIVPPKARDLLNFPTRGRRQLQGKLVELLADFGVRSRRHGDERDATASVR